MFTNLPTIFGHKLNWKEALLGLRLHHNIIIDGVRHVILSYIWRNRCKIVFNTPNDHHGAALLGLYSNIFYCLISIFSLLHVEVENNLQIDFQIQQIKLQVTQLLIKRKVIIAQGLRSYFQDWFCLFQLLFYVWYYSSCCTICYSFSCMLYCHVIFSYFIYHL